LAAANSRRCASSSCVNSPPSPWSRAGSSAATRFETERRSYISSRALSAAAFAAARGHWAIENKLHWVLDVTFREDLSRLRAGHGANWSATYRSIKRRRKRASWDPQYLLDILGPLRC
jgi:hypothetical protein